MNKRVLLKIMVVGIISIAMIMGIANINSFEKTEMITTTGYSYEKAIVTGVIKDNISEEGMRVGYQQLEVKLLTGAKEGEIVAATSSEGNLFGAICKKGDRVIVNISTINDQAVVSVYSKDRSTQIYGYIAVFIILICLIGGKNGIKSVLGLAFTFISIVWIYMPAVYQGYSPFLVSIVVCVVTTLVTMVLIGGISKKSICAIIGTISGVVIAGVSAWLFGLSADIDGYNVSNIETLMYVAQNTKIQVGDLLFSGILIASLGAVMDVAMSVSSTIVEIKENAPDIPTTQLLKSGMKVGKDMMGTMSNTLILAFVGGALSTLVVDYAYDLPFIQMINSYYIGIEIMQGIAGSIGVILAVPITVVVTSFVVSKNFT